MVMADRYEGQHAGRCGCGAELIWVRDSEGSWVTTHSDTNENLYCSFASNSDSSVPA